MRRIGRLLFVGPFVVATAGGNGGRMGYDHRWRILAPISTRFKIVLNRCDLCGERISRCECPEYDGS